MWGVVIKALTPWNYDWNAFGTRLSKFGQSLLGNPTQKHRMLPQQPYQRGMEENGQIDFWID